MSFRVKHLSHFDVDGTGGVILSRHVFGRVEYELCDHENIDRRVMDFLKQQRGADPSDRFDLLVITDISVEESTAEALTKAITELGIKVILCDHHAKALWLNIYSWANVVVDYQDANNRTVRTCGTSLWADYLLMHYPIEEPLKSNMLAFAEHVRQWDTFEWHRNGNMFANELNIFHTIKGKDKYIERFVQNFNMEWTYEEKVLIDEERLRIRRYIHSKVSEASFTVDSDGRSVAFVYAEQHVSDIGHRICKLFPDVDYAIVLSLSTQRASLRTLKDNIDLGVIASAHGGGGRGKRAGFSTKDLFKVTLPFLSNRREQIRA